LSQPNPRPFASAEGTFLGSAVLYRPFDAAALFVRSWDAVVRSVERARGRQGVSLILVDGAGRALAEAWIAASLDVVRAGVVRPARCASPSARRRSRSATWSRWSAPRTTRT
jgi:hypothetical protein